MMRDLRAFELGAGVAEMPTLGGQSAGYGTDDPRNTYSVTVGAAGVADGASTSIDFSAGFVSLSRRIGSRPWRLVGAVGRSTAGSLLWIVTSMQTRDLDLGQQFVIGDSSPFPLSVALPHPWNGELVAQVTNRSGGVAGLFLTLIVGNR